MAVFGYVVPLLFLLHIGMHKNNIKKNGQLRTSQINYIGVIVVKSYF